LTPAALVHYTVRFDTTRAYHAGDDEYWVRYRNLRISRQNAVR
jgi:hypothetical protein